MVRPKSPITCPKAWWEFLVKKIKETDQRGFDVQENNIISKTMIPTNSIRETVLHFREMNAFVNPF